MLPELYQTHFQQYLKPSDYLLLEILINLLQSIKQVNLEKLATSLPLPILFESRRKKIQRFLSLPEWNVKIIWLSLITQWINASIKQEEVLYLARDRTRWQSTNILVISWIYNRRAIPLYFELLDKKGNSNLSEQTKTIAHNLEGTKVTGERLISLLILISIAYTLSTFSGQKIKSIGIQNYIGRVKELNRTSSRHSNFYIGLYGYSWLYYWFNLSEKITQLMNLSLNKRPFYQRGQKAMKLILSAF